MRFGSRIFRLIIQNERLFLFVPVLFGLGIGSYFSLPFEPDFTFILPLVAALALAVFLCRRKQIPYFFFLGAFIFVLGFESAQFETMQKHTKRQFFKANTVTYLKGRIKQSDLSLKAKPRFLLENVSDFEKPLNGLYRITTNDKTTYQIGDCIETAAVLTPPSPPLKPGSYRFDRYAFFEGISAVGYTLTPLYQIDCPQKTDIASHINQNRKNISAFISQTLNKDEAAIATALLTGNKNLISKHLYAQYRKAGLAHFLAISGLHIGLIATFFFLLARFVFSTVPFFALKFSTHKLAAFCAVLFAFAYLLLSGASLSERRAFIMVSLVFLGLIFDRKALSMRTIALAALIILILEPHALLQAGFQMSFAATTALIAIYEVYQPKIAFNKSSLTQKIGLYFFSVIITTLIASLATLPYTIYHFRTFALYALLSNVLAAPVIAFIVMPFIFISLLLYPFSLGSYPLYIAGFGLSLINRLTGFVSSLPLADLSVPPMPTFGLIFITLGGLWICLVQTKTRFFGVILILLGFISYAFIKTPDVLYTADGQTVGFVNKQKGELIIFSKKKNDSLAQVWSQGFKNVKTYKNLQSMKDISVACNHESCRYQNLLTFDLNGHLSLENKQINTQSDLGGALYVKNGNIYKQTIRQSIGLRPFNSL